MALFSHARALSASGVAAVRNSSLASVKGKYVTTAIFNCYNMAILDAKFAWPWVKPAVSYVNVPV